MLWILQLSIWQPVVPWNTRLRRSWHQWPWQFFVFGVGHCQTLEDAPHQTEVNHVHWSPTVPVSVWLPESARDRGSKQESLNDDFYHTTSRSAAIFGVQTVLSYLVLTLNLWIGLCSMKRSSGEWSFGDVSVTYHSRAQCFGTERQKFRYRTKSSGNRLPEPWFR